MTGAPTPVRFPAIARDELPSGLRVWSLPWPVLPIVTVALLIEAGASSDAVEQPGLASLTADLADEGAGGRNAIELSEAFASLGSHLETDIGHDHTALSFTTLSKNLDAALGLVADIIIRPHLADEDLRRIRDLRVSRLRQLKTSASANADRAFLQAVFGSHPYGHGTMGTTNALGVISLDDIRSFFSNAFVPRRATLVVAGDVDAQAVNAIARARFHEWRNGRTSPPAPPPPEPPIARCFLVHRPDAPQSELRIGHLGPSRRSPVFHAMMTLNAALGGQFTSRINQQLRETKGYTYGARTNLDFHKDGSTFECDTSVQSNATADSIADVLAEFTAAGSSRPIEGDELARAQNSLTRGYVRHFETPAHLVRAAVELVKFELPDDTFDRFVPEVASVTADDVRAAARQFVRPDDCVVVVVADAEKHRTSLSGFNRDVVEMTPEF